MPAKNAGQLRAAYAAAKKGQAWGKEMIAKTPEKMQSRMMKGTHPKGGGKRGKSKGRR
jgi:hypothetical protein